MPSEEVEKLFRENDNLGSDSSVFLRPMRHLLVRGAPPGEMVPIYVEMPDGSGWPIGVLTCTKKNRIVFWPVLPQNAATIAAERKSSVIDHITLEMPSQVSHLTVYKSDGTIKRTGASDVGHQQSWRLHRFGRNSLALWFQMLVSRATLIEQDLLVQRLTNAPTSKESQRRIDEFVKYAEHLNRNAIRIRLLPADDPIDHLFVIVGMGVDENVSPDFSSEIASECATFHQVPSCPTGAVIAFQPTRLRFGDQEFIVAVASPPGHFEGDVSVGLPRTKVR